MIGLKKITLEHTKTSFGLRRQRLIGIWNVGMKEHERVPLYLNVLRSVSECILAREEHDLKKISTDVQRQFFVCFHTGFNTEYIELPDGFVQVFGVFMELVLVKFF